MWLPPDNDQPTNRAFKFPLLGGSKLHGAPAGLARLAAARAAPVFRLPLPPTVPPTAPSSPTSACPLACGPASPLAPGVQLSRSLEIQLFNVIELNT